MATLSFGLVVLAAAPKMAVYGLGWAVLGLGMAAGLYDAAFSTLGRINAAQARSAISQLTLWGGFASSVCWPISAVLVEAWGWRGTCLFYAALHLSVTLPLCVVGIPRPPAAETAAGTPVPTIPLGRRFWILLTPGTLISLLVTILSVHLLALLQAPGLTLAVAAAMGAVIAPSHFGARLVEMVFGSRAHPVWTMLAATGPMAVGVAMMGHLGAVATLQNLAALALVPAAVLLWRDTRNQASAGQLDIGQHRIVIAGAEAKDPLAQHVGIAHGAQSIGQGDLVDGAKQVGPIAKVIGRPGHRQKPQPGLTKCLRS